MPPPKLAGYGDTYMDLPGMGIHALGPNAIVILSGEVWTAEAAEALRGVVRDDVMVIGVAEGADLASALAVVTADQMRVAGWMRVDDCERGNGERGDE